MRIAVFAPDPATKDGIAAHTHHLVEEWERAGHTIMWAFPDRGAYVATSNPQPYGDASRHRTRLHKSLRTFDPDVAIVQFAVSAVRTSLCGLIMTARSLKRAGVPVLICCHEASRELALLGPLSRLIFKSLRWSGTRFVAFSEVESRLMMKYDLASNVVTVPHGVGSSHIDPAEVERVRTMYGIRSPAALVIGWITRSKGADLLLRAAPDVTAGMGKLQCVVAGEPRPRNGIFRPFGWADERYAAALTRKAATLGDTAEVTMIGYVPDEDLGPLMKAASVVVLPYRTVTQSGIAARAMAVGTPIVASDLPGMAAQLGEAARYFRPGDDQCLASALSDVLGDGDLRDKLTSAARSRASQESYERVAEAILAAVQI